MLDDDDLPTFSSAEEEARYFRSTAKDLCGRLRLPSAICVYSSLDSDAQLEETREALEEFQKSSSDLEAELEKELAATEKRERDLRATTERLQGEVTEWKVSSMLVLR